jgi:dihydrofolate synthase/folylpolyglutamate synthase
LDYNKFKTIIKLKSGDETITYSLNLFGKFQAYNFLCAYHTLNYLKVSHQSIKYAAENTQHLGRFEIKSQSPLLILDATHNLAGAKSLVDSLNNIFKPEDVVIISSILADKDVEQILEQFAFLAQNIICTTIVNNPRVLLAQDMGVLAKKYFTSVQVINDSIQALLIAKKMKKRMILVTGSMYLLGSFYPHISV